MNYSYYNKITLPFLVQVFIMNVIENSIIYCPYCNEQIQLQIDCSQPAQEYIEDCHVCCQPILLQVNISPENELIVKAHQENE